MTHSAWILAIGLLQCSVKQIQLGDNRWGGRNNKSEARKEIRRKAMKRRIASILVLIGSGTEAEGEFSQEMLKAAAEGQTLRSQERVWRTEKLCRDLLTCRL